MPLAIVCGMCKAVNQNEDFTKTQILEILTVSHNWQLISHTPVIQQFLIWAQSNGENDLMPGQGQLSLPLALCWTGHLTYTCVWTVSNSDLSGQQHHPPKPLNRQLINQVITVYKSLTVCVWEYIWFILINTI